VILIAHAMYAEHHFLKRLGVDIAEIPGILAKKVFGKKLVLSEIY
jgi:hypothetical protein